MKLRNVQRVLPLVGLLVFLPLAISVPCSWGGLLRITMNDGTSVEVPYFWEEGGEVKFEIAGGVAGVSRAQVTSIQEVLAAKEFDPEVLMEAPRDKASLDHQKILENLLASKVSESQRYEKLDPQEGSRLLGAGGISTRESRAPAERVHASKFNVEGSFHELVRVEGTGVMLLVRNILSSRHDLSTQSFALTLYDENGNVLQKKNCDLQQVDADNKTMRQLDVRGRLYLVSTMVKPDPKIKRYEITASPR